MANNDRQQDGGYGAPQEEQQGFVEGGYGPEGGFDPEGGNDPEGGYDPGFIPDFITDVVDPDPFPNVLPPEGGYVGLLDSDEDAGEDVGDPYGYGDYFGW